MLQSRLCTRPLPTRTSSLLARTQISCSFQYSIPVPKTRRDIQNCTPIYIYLHVATPQRTHEADCRRLPVTRCQSSLFIYQNHVTTYNFWSTSVHPDRPISRLTVCAVIDSQIQNASHSSAVEALSVERYASMPPQNRRNVNPIAHYNHTGPHLVPYVPRPRFSANHPSNSIPNDLQCAPGSRLYFPRNKAIKSPPCEHKPARRPFCPTLSGSSLRFTMARTTTR